MRSKARSLQVEVKTVYLGDESHPDAERYTFAYTVTMKNTGTIPAKLLGRRFPTATDAVRHPLPSENGCPAGPDARHRHVPLQDLYSHTRSKDSSWSASTGLAM